MARLTQQAATSATLAELDAVLVSRVFLVGYHFSLADIAVYSSLRGQFSQNLVFEGKSIFLNSSL